jgi:Bacterial toxin 47
MQNQHLAPVYIEEFAINSVVSVSDACLTSGIGQDSDKASSTSKAGISGVAGNTAARTGDQETGLITIFDIDKVNKNLDAQVGLVQEVAPAAAKAWGQYANNQMTNDKLSAEERACWAPDGACRAGGHALIGGLTAGGPGAAGAGLTSVAAPHVYTTLVNNGISPDVAQSLTTLGAAGFAAQLGGTPAATAAANEAVNNFGMFIRLAQIASDKATRFGQATLTAGERAILSAAAALGVVSAQKALQAPEPRFDNSQLIPTSPNMVAPPPEGKDSNNTGNTKPPPNYSGSTVTPVEQRDPRDGVLINPAAPPVNAGSNNTGGNQIVEPKPGSNVITTPIAAPQGPNIMMSNGYVTKPTDSTASDWRVGVDQAFDKIGLPKNEYEVTKWAFDKNGKSFPVEWRHPSGAEVNIDIGHTNPDAPSLPHIGWQTGGKRSAGGKTVGHIFVPDVPVNRSPVK